MSYVIGCDVGSQSLKALLLSEKGQICGETSASYSIEYPHPTWAEQSAGAWVKALCEAVKEVVARSGVEREAVRGLGLATQVDGVVAVNARGEPIYPAIIWMDRRAVEQCAAAGEHIDPNWLFGLTGLNLDASHVAPKIRWLYDQEPEVAQQTSRFLLPGSYMGYALTGEVGVDYSNASSTLLMDVSRRQWAPELFELFGVPFESMAPILPSTSVLGRLLPDLAEELGLTAQTQVVLGSGDEHAACLGAGVTSPGLVCDIGGTAEPVCAASYQPAFDPSGLVETHCHAHPDLWLLENPGFVSGANYRWFRDQFASEEVASAREAGRSAYDALNELAATVPPGSEGVIFLPCLMGAMAPTWNAAARGTFFGFTLAHTRAHFVRAILEGSAYAVRDITDRMLQIGLNLRQILAVGGGARSPLWRQIKADVTGLPVALPATTETTALGAALLAQVGTGVCSSLEEAASQAVHIVEVRQPEAVSKERYEEAYQLYRSTYNALLPVFDQAAGLAPKYESD